MDSESIKALHRGKCLHLCWTTTIQAPSIRSYPRANTWLFSYFILLLYPEEHFFDKNKTAYYFKHYQHIHQWGSNCQDQSCVLKCGGQKILVPIQIKTRCKNVSVSLSFQIPNFPSTLWLSRMIMIFLKRTL